MLYCQIVYGLCINHIKILIHTLFPYPKTNVFYTLNIQSYYYLAIQCLTILSDRISESHTVPAACTSF